MACVGHSSVSGFLGAHNVHALGSQNLTKLKQSWNHQESTINNTSTIVTAGLDRSLNRV